MVMKVMAVTLSMIMAVIIMVMLMVPLTKMPSLGDNGGAPECNAHDTSDFLAFAASFSGPMPLYSSVDESSEN